MLLCPPAGFTITADGYAQAQFSTVQQLQDSSTLESQALSSSYHPQNLLHVPSQEVVSPAPSASDRPTFHGGLPSPHHSVALALCRE